MLSAFIAALLNPLGVIGSKTAMKKLKINYAAFASMEMAFIFFLGIAPFVLWGEVADAFFTPKYLLYFLGIVFFGFLHNFFYFLSLSKDDLCNVEPIAMLEPLVSVVLAAIIFQSERNWPVLVLAVVASLALVLSRLHKNRIKLSKYALTMLGFVICFAAEGIFIKLTLPAINPVALYVLRVGVITALLLGYFRPNLKVFGEKRVLSLFAIAVVVLLEFFSRYAAIDKLGIVESSLIFLLGPVLVLLGSRFYLKEKYTPATIVANVIIVTCVALIPIVT